MHTLHDQLSTTESVAILQLNNDERELLREIMEISRGHVDETMITGILCALDRVERDGCVRLEVDLATKLRVEVRSAIRAFEGTQQSTQLARIPEYKTRMSDEELCLLIKAQLEKGNVIILPEIEIMQLVDLMNRSSADHPDMALFFSLGKSLLQLKKRHDLEAAESLFEIELPPALADELRAMLAEIRMTPENEI